MSQADSEADAPGAALSEMANAIRVLSMDAVERANSGHPGMPMGAADIATALFARHLKFDASRPDWPDRDRFVLSAGHGSMLLYALGYLLGYEGMTVEELKRFRQLGSKTPGHPEYGHSPMVETTTGPLGQGLANAVGFAIAEAHLAARYGDDLVDHYTYVLASDGDLMEGISHEAISLAGGLKLRKLIVLYDDNEISIDGRTSLSDGVDHVARFEAAGWIAERVDGHDIEALDAAIARARKTASPHLIACKTVIGKGSPKKQGTEHAHGAPLGADEIAAARQSYGWTAAPFETPDDILGAWRDVGARGAEARADWEDRLEQAPQDRRRALEAVLAGDISSEVDGALDAKKKDFAESRPEMATRKASGATLAVINTHTDMTVGGSADLTGSNNTRTPDLDALDKDNYGGRYIHYGVREHAMAAAMNGMALHGGVVPYGGTFLIFSDYCRPSIRLAALMKQRVVFVMTHDSIGVGEDGPTHQPVEQLAALRAIPNLNVFRPADAVETVECWQAALASRDRPSVMTLTRQNLPTARTAHVSENLCARGAYEISPADGDAQAVLFATGSEVAVAIAAQALLKDKGVAARVVSTPSWELFEAQPQEYRDAVLGAEPARIAIEAAIGQGWERYIGRNGAFIGMDSFGASAPAGDLYDYFGITAEAAAAAVLDRLSEQAG